MKRLNYNYNKKNNYSILLILFIYLFVFEFALMNVSSVFGYWDEFYAFLALPIALIRPQRKISLTNFVIFLTLIAFIIFTLIGNIKYNYQSASYVMLDIFLHLKFPLSIITTIFLFNKVNIKELMTGVKRQCFYIIDLLFILLIMNYGLHYFPFHEIRFGIPSQQLFFGHPTRLATVSFFLLMLITLKFEGSMKDKIHIAMLLFIVVSTLRTKAILSIFTYVYLYYWIIVLKRELSAFAIAVIGVAAILFGWNQINFYFLDYNATQTARGALTYVSSKIAKSSFPFGSGFGTFGSAPSGDNYSPVYALYGISNVWGLSRVFHNYISDTFWPMILGQSGFLGLSAYIIFLIELFVSFTSRLKDNSLLYGTALAIFSYLLISSTSESAFVNPSAVFLGFVLGIVFLLNQRFDK